ncbi:3',5'-cyclic AMP phosphodiesterase CpdA [Methylobacter tundripaludum]|uniref:3',5'-cyclic AMP phosphodiesterase CpdA n=1 Tax=Methylobacter tundripaludum TaxID=173365 RepID=A0A2S6H7F3_9GAMM|nr:metallophosphoesterase [Methylobacter tundripaludum]PPK73414.1 3',5'-cyclic AMP phosphodiesterase CpdA [Methylobacter tundripaludum]
MDNPIRWLHLSDFHVGKDNYAQKRLFDKIIEHVKDQGSKGFVPDLVFITGDIANKGLKAEYETFRKGFIAPLQEVLGGAAWTGNIFCVPGNHDVDRSKNAIFDRAQTTISGSHFFDPTKEGKTARDVFSPRFKQYRQLAPGNVSVNWISAAEGAYAEPVTIQERRIGVIGINTAWLSKDECDKDKLTPGFQLVEAALVSEKIKTCEVRIVLGHHPLHWLIEEDVRRLRTLFGRHRVIYLHGHMHRAEGRREEGAGESFLVFQAGAAFQARDDEPWRNGLLWGELDCSKHELRLSPRYWNPDNMDWPTETGRFPEKLRVPNSDWWAYELPTSDEIKPSSWQAPDGWTLIDFAALESHRRDIAADEAERFFDGAEPDWSLALCSYLPRRTVVDCLVERIATYQGKERPLVVLLTGPGGEGKSMAGRQTVVGLFERDPDLRVLWRNDDTASLAPEQLLSLPQGSSWLVATDAADLTAKALYQAMEALSVAGRSDVRFLLTARESDWRAAGGASLTWVNRADFQQETLSGLTEADASVIAGAWLKFGRVDCQGDAAGNQGELSQRLFNAAKAEASLGEGALLGGVLVIRKGEGLRAHVRSLLDRLQEISLANGNSLYTAFGYIAAMHAEGLDFLSRPALAEALGCKTSSLQKEVLFPLGREAAAGGGMMIRTRHRRIAAAVIEIMQEEFGEDIGEYYLTLCRAALAARSKGSYVPELKRWDYDLPEYFLQKHSGLAIQIGRALQEQDPNNTNLAVNLARIYRQSDDPENGARVLREFKGEVSSTRVFWYEWGTCAGGTGDQALSAWLDGWSLADQSGVAPPDNDRAKMSLAGLGVAFAELSKSYLDPVFIEARHSMGQLGLRLRLDTTTHRYFENHLAETEAVGVRPTDLAGSFNRLQTGLLRAWENCAERESLAERMPKPQTMYFEGLKRLFPLG